MKTSFTSQTWATLISFAVFIAVLLTTFSVQLKAASAGLDRWVGHEDHRLPNIRLVPLKCRWSAIERFIDLQPVEDADLFIFGDSQMFARGATQEELFSTQWLGPESTVVNFSFLAASISDMRKISDELHSRDIRVPMSLTNINLTHYVIPFGVPEPIDTEDASLYLKISRFFGQLNKRVLLPERPSRLSRLYTNRHICSFRMRKAFANDRLRTPRYRKLLPEFRQVSLKDFFVNFTENDFFKTITPNIENLERVSKRTVFITAPMAYDKFSLYGFDTDNLDKFSKAFKDLCSQHTTLECYDIIRSINSEGFMDLIHMNAKGHARLGEVLRETIPTQ